MLDAVSTSPGETPPYRSADARLNTASPRRSLPAAWEQLAHELDRTYRPSARASLAVREIVRGIAAEMLAVGASREDVRRSLSRIVIAFQQSIARRFDIQERAVHDALLADVLRCAADAPS